jgi:hypothetical protein
MGNPPPSPGFHRRQASAFAKALADKLADELAGQVGVRRWRGGWKMVNYPLNLLPAKKSGCARGQIRSRHILEKLLEGF